LIPINAHKKQRGQIKKPSVGSFEDGVANPHRADPETDAEAEYARRTSGVRRASQEEEIQRLYRQPDGIDADQPRTSRSQVRISSTAGPSFVVPPVSLTASSGRAKRVK